MIYDFRLREVRDRFIADTSENTSFTFVSVHARRTDYGSHLKILYNLTYVDKSYFLRAMEYFSGKVKVVTVQRTDLLWHSF